MHAEALMYAERATNPHQAQIFGEVANMTVGQRLRVEAYEMRLAFAGYSVFDARPPEDQFLEKMRGANYGAWTCTYHFTPAGDYYVIGHHEAGDEKVREDWDRR